MRDEKLEKWRITPKHDVAMYNLLEEYQSIIQQTFEVEDSGEYFDTLLGVCGRMLKQYKNNYFVCEILKAYMNYQSHRVDKEDKTALAELSEVLAKVGKFQNDKRISKELQETIGASLDYLNEAIHSELTKQG